MGREKKGELEFQQREFKQLEAGSLRGLTPTVVETLRALGILSDKELSLLEMYHHPKVLSYRKEVVGKVRPTFDLREDEGEPKNVSARG
jgi:hypothetical protein